MCAELANLNPCAVPFLSRAAFNLCWYYYRTITTLTLFPDYPVLLKHNILITSQRYLLEYWGPTRSFPGDIGIKLIFYWLNLFAT